MTAIEAVDLVVLCQFHQDVLCSVDRNQSNFLVRFKELLLDGLRREKHVGVL